MQAANPPTKPWWCAGRGKACCFYPKPGWCAPCLHWQCSPGLRCSQWKPTGNPPSPALTRLAWLFGAVSFAGFASAIVGSKLAEKTDDARVTCWFVGCCLRWKALLSCALLLLVPVRSAGMFTGVYMLTYLVLGGGGVAESTLLNREAPASQRASILSLFSFVLQIGGLLASLAAWLVSASGGFRTLWVMAGVLLVAASGLFGAIHARGGKTSVPAQRGSATDAAMASPAFLPCR